jgi:tetratricopeptide (TPR) repeat protein
MPKRHDTIRVEELPPVKISWWCVACCHLFRVLVERILRLLRFRAYKRLRRILDELQKKGKSILGKPRYILDGSGYETSLEDGKRVTPDYVEIYIQNGCRIDMLYLNGEHIGTSGAPLMYQWDAVCYELRRKKNNNKRTTQATRVSDPQESFDNRIITKKTLSDFLTSNNLNSTLPEHWRDEIYHDYHYLGKSGDFEKIQETAERWIDEIYHYLDESSEYETIQDLYSILRRTEKAYRYYSREMRDTTGLAQFVVRLSLVDLNFRNWALGKLLSSVHLQILQKYESECL